MNKSNPWHVIKILEENQRTDNGGNPIIGLSYDDIEIIRDSLPDLKAAVQMQSDEWHRKAMQVDEE